jgi:UDP-galactopyranose mutase
MNTVNTAQNSERLLLCFSQLRWGFVFQRPQHLMTRAAQTYKVVFWEEPVFEGDTAPHLASYPQDCGVLVVCPRFAADFPREQVNANLRAMLDRFLAETSARPAISWYITPAMLPFSQHVKADVVVYDNMDELSAFANAPKELLHLEKQLLRKADVVFTGGMSIYEAKRNRHANIHPFPSSIDKNHFGKARSKSADEPKDQAGIAGPRVGWFGVIDERFDSKLLGDLAARRPDWQFVMLGPVVKIDPATLPQASNIHWLGGKDYKELPQYMAGWDAGIIPFAINDSTRFISPTKTPEYLSAGLPVVATPIKDIVRPYGERGLVEIVSTAREAETALNFVLSMPRAPWLAQVDQFLSDMSWDNTWSAMCGQIEACKVGTVVETAPVVEAA